MTEKSESLIAQEKLNISTKDAPDALAEKKEDEPQINKKMYWCSLVMGIATLEPWNGILTCMYYFQTLYEPAGYKPQFTLPMIIFFPLVSFQIVLIALGKHFPMKAKLVGGLGMLTFLFFIFLLFAKGIANLDMSFYVAILIVLLLGTFNAVAQGTAGGLCGAMGGNGQYMGACMIGNGVSGVMSNLLQFACLLIIGNQDSDLFKVTMLFFIIIAFVMMGSTYVGYLMVEDPFTQEILSKPVPDKSLKDIFRLAWPVFKGQGKNVFLTFTLTFCVFPGVFLASPLKCFSSAWSIPMMIFGFNVFDTIGRYSPSILMLASPKGTFWLNLARALCSISICTIGYKMFDGALVADWWIIVNIVLFSFSNGAGSTLAMIYGTADFEEKDKEDAGKMMVFFLTGGIFFGSLLAQLIFANLF